MRRPRTGERGVRDLQLDVGFCFAETTVWLRSALHKSRVENALATRYRASMKAVFPLVYAALCACAVVPEAQGPDTPMTLVFADDFDRPGAPDPERWAFDTHRNAQGWYNEELQYYGPDNARVADGSLRITARRGAPAGASDYGGQLYSSARLHTKGRFAFRYGRAEARIKVPCGRGLWPAFWMLPEGEHGWPEGGEIDIMEFVGHQPRTFHATIHTAASNHLDGTETGDTVRVRDACDAWHTHRLDWTADRITVSLDGEPYFTFANPRAGDDFWPFDKDFHLLLNMAVGGTWGGREGVDPNAFPAVMEVDYVRVWQAEDPARR